jgi:hypothetical protein
MRIEHPFERFERLRAADSGFGRGIHQASAGPLDHRDPDRFLGGKVPENRALRQVKRARDVQCGNALRTFAGGEINGDADDFVPALVGSQTLPGRLQTNVIFSIERVIDRYLTS